MDIHLHRMFRSDKATMGELWIGGSLECITLEDPIRDIGPNKEGKIAGETGIPAGKYTISLVYSPKFDRTMPILVNVAHFTGILIHPGNTPADTRGCILVGDKAEDSLEGIKPGTSKVAFDRLFAKLKDAWSRKEAISIEITDDFKLQSGGSV